MTASAERIADAVSLLDMFAASWNASDADALAATFATDGDYVEFSGHWLQGRDQIRDAHRFVLDGPLSGSSIRFTDHAIRGVSTELILIHAHWNLTGIPSAVDPTGTRTGIITFTCVQAIGRASFAAGHNTLILGTKPFGDR